MFIPSIRTWLPDQALPFSRWRFSGIAVIISALLVTAGTLAFFGLNLGLDFTGGVLGGGAVTHGFRCRCDPRGPRGRRSGDRVDPVVGWRHQRPGAGALGRRRSARCGAGSALGAGAELRSQEAVGPKVSGELLRRGLTASLATVVAIAVYVWLRFETRFGLAAFLTTLHDVALMVGFYAVTRLPFDLTSIAAILLIAGYSINDTVVVFDRLREWLRKSREMPLEEVIDRSITETLRRTMMTSGTTMVTSLSLMIFGGPALFGFAAAVTFGIAVGTVSSIFVAAPLLLHLPGPLPGRAEQADPLGAVKEEDRGPVVDS